MWATHTSPENLTCLFVCRIDFYYNKVKRIRLKHITHEIPKLLNYVNLSRKLTSN